MIHTFKINKREYIKFITISSSLKIFLNYDKQQCAYPQLTTEIKKHLLPLNIFIREGMLFYLDFIPQNINVTDRLVTEIHNFCRKK